MKGLTLNSTLDRVVIKLADRLDLSLEQLKAIATLVNDIPDAETKNAAIFAIAKAIPVGPVHPELGIESPRAA